MESPTIEGRSALLDLLTRYSLQWPDEHPVIARIQALVEKHNDCFHRSCLPGHITGSALVLSPDRRRCLLLHHRKLDRWLQPGGHADGDSNVLRVAIRETEEESGLTGVVALGEDQPVVPLDLDVHTIPARHDSTGACIEPEHEHHDVRFLLTTVDQSPLVVTPESNDVRWCTPDEAHTLTQEESVLRLLRKSQGYFQ